MSLNNTKTIYLDYAAATPVDPEVIKVMQPYFGDKFYNPSATYLAGQQVAKDVNKARSGIAKWLGSRPSEIVFTAGGSEANNLAIQGVMQSFPGSNMITSAIEHESVLKPAENYKHKIAKVMPNGIIDVVDLAKKIDDDTALISIMYANNEIGTIQPIAEVASIIKKVLSQRKKLGNELPLYLHTDACQAGSYLDLHVARLGVDLMTINGGKIYGPKQSGFLYVKTHTKLTPQILGGGQELGMRSGTENVAFIVGIARALDKCQTHREKEAKRQEKLQNQFIRSILSEIPSAKLNGSLKKRLPNNAHLTFPGQDNELLMMRLDEQGIMCAVGSACSASNEQPSHVLKAIGLSEKDAQSSLRFSLGSFTKEADIKLTVKLLKKAVNNSLA